MYSSSFFLISISAESNKRYKFWVFSIL
jgi:hypothetical protein